MELRVTREGCVIFDNEDEVNVKGLQQLIPADDIYLFCLLYMETLETVMQYLKDAYGEVFEDLIEDMRDEVLAARHCSEALDLVYMDHFTEGNKSSE